MSLFLSDKQFGSPKQKKKTPNLVNFTKKKGVSTTVFNHHSTIEYKLIKVRYGKEKKNSLYRVIQSNPLAIKTLANRDWNERDLQRSGKMTLRRRRRRRRKEVGDGRAKLAACGSLSP